MKNTLSMTVLFLGLTTLFTIIFNLYSDLRIFLPVGLYTYPPKDLTKWEVDLIKFILRWIIPGIIVGIFLWKANIKERLNSRLALTLISIGTALIVLNFSLLYLAALIPGGGALFAFKSYINYFVGVPSKAILFVGAINLLMTLKPNKTLNIDRGNSSASS